MKTCFSSDYPATKLVEEEHQVWQSLFPFEHLSFFSLLLFTRDWTCCVSRFYHHILLFKLFLTSSSFSAPSEEGQQGPKILLSMPQRRESKRVFISRFLRHHHQTCSPRSCFHWLQAIPPDPTRNILNNSDGTKNFRRSRFDGFAIGLHWDR